MNRHSTKQIMTSMVDRRPAGNSGLAIGGVSYSADTFVLSSTVGLRINFCGKMPAHRQAAKRWR